MRYKMFDTHMHCEFSGDSKMKILKARQAAEKLDIGIVITEHMDIEYPTNPLSFVFDVNEYFEAFDRYRSDKLLLGVEIGMQARLNDTNSKIVHSGSFDMVIGSIHVASGVDVYMSNFYRGRERVVAYGLYFADMLQCVSSYEDYDTLGHIDYICRYARYEDPELDIVEHGEVWQQICKELIARDKALEINTRRLDSKLAVRKLQPFYEMYAQLGGKYVTIGSDAHSDDLVGCRVAQGFEWAESMGLQPVYFKQRKLQMDFRL